MESAPGTRIRALRRRLGLSQTDLGAPEYSASYISLIEAGKRVPELHVLEYLAARLDTSAQFLLHGTEPEAVSQQRLRLQLAEVALEAGDTAAARLGFTALVSARRREIRHEARWGLARTEQLTGNYSAALDLLDSLEEPAARAEPGAPPMLRVHAARCDAWRAAGDYTRAIECGESAMQQVAELGLSGTEDDIRLATALVGCYWGRGDRLSAARLADQVLGRAEKVGTRHAQAGAYRNACLIAEARGELPLALDLAGRAQTALAGDSSAGPLARMRVTHAWLLLRCDPPRLDQADDMLARAHAVLAVGSLRNLASCQTEMARSLLLRGDPEGAARLAEAALQTALLHASHEEEGHARVVRGLALVVRGQLDEGHASVAAGAAELAARGERQEAARAWRDLSEALLVGQQDEMALSALRRAADLAGATAASIRADLGTTARQSTDAS
jgi:transcriptional regulator with XRE-family HTH domain